jgi:hypothetical protein
MVISFGEHPCCVPVSDFCFSNRPVSRPAARNSLPRTGDTSRGSRWPLRVASLPECKDAFVPRCGDAPARPVPGREHAWTPRETTSLMEKPVHSDCVPRPPVAATSPAAPGVRAHETRDPGKRIDLKPYGLGYQCTSKCQPNGLQLWRKNSLRPAEQATTLLRSNLATSLQ